MAQVKGTAVLSSLRYVHERFGEEPLARVLAALPEQDAALRGGLLASSWYHRRAVVELSGLEGSAPQFCERIHGWAQRRGDPVCRFEGNWD